MSGQLDSPLAAPPLHVRRTGPRSRFDQTDLRDALALFVLGMASAIVCTTTSGLLQLMTGLVALTSPLMGHALIREPARPRAEPGVSDGG